MLFKNNPEVAKKAKVAIVVSEFRKDYTMKLLNKCQDYLFDKGIRERYLDVFWVPGAFEIPLKTKLLAKDKKYNVIITLGCLLKGDTLHFELVANECARALMQIMLEYEVPVVFEVLACLTKKDAERRAGDNENNRGVEAAQTALKLLHECCHI